MNNKPKLNPLRKRRKKRRVSAKSVSPIGQAVAFDLQPGMAHSAALNAFEWTQKYLTVFSDYYLEKQFKRVLERKYISKYFLDQVWKRSQNISNAEIAKKSLYVRKHLGPISILVEIIRGNVKDETAEDLLQFFQKFNYFTAKQRAFIRVNVQKRHGMEETHSQDPKVLAEADSIIKRNLKSKGAKKVEKDPGLTFTQLVLDEEKEKKGKEEKKQKKQDKKIEKGFMSVTEARYKLRAKE